MRPLAPFIGKFVEFVDPKREEQAFCAEQGQWYVAQTEPRRERMAEGSIGEAGLITYMPLKLERVRAGYQARLVERPMFPDYLFIRCLAHADHWQRIKRARGINSLLGQEQPLALADEAIESIRLFEARSAEALRGKPKGPSRDWSFKEGDVVRITQGPFAGFYAQLQSSVNHQDRVRALLDLFKRAAIIEVSAHDLADKSSFD